MTPSRLSAALAVGLSAVAIFALAYMWVPEDVARDATALPTEMRPAESESPKVLPTVGPSSDRSGLLVEVQGAADVPSAALPPVVDQGAVPPALTRFVLSITDSHDQPVVGAEITVWDDFPKGSTSCTPTLVRSSDGLGRCLVETAPSGVAFASKTSVGTSGLVRLSSVARDNGSIGVHTVAIVLQPQATVVGRVLEWDGSVVPEATVHFEPSRFETPGVEPRQPADVVSRRDGSFEVDVDVGGDYYIIAKRNDATLDDDVPSSEALVEPKPGGRHPVTLVFPGQFAVSGKLVDWNNEPTRGIIRIWRDPSNGSTPFRSADDGSDPDDVLTTAEGTFQVRLATPGRYLLSGMADDRAPSNPIVVNVSAESPWTSVDVVLPAPAYIAGHLATDDGSPVSGAIVRAAPLDSHEAVMHEFWPQDSTAAPVVSATTDDTGGFCLGPVSRSMRYGISWTPAEGRFLVSSEIAQAVAGDRLDLRVHLPSDAGSVVVTVSPEALNDGRSDCSWMLHRRIGTTDVSQVVKPEFTSNGYRFNNLTIGEDYAVSVNYPGMAPARTPWMTITPATLTATLAVAELSSLTVTGLSGGSTAAGAYDTCRVSTGSNTWTEPAIASPAGTAEFTDLVPGKHDIQVRRHAEWITVGSVDLPSGGSIVFPISLRRD